jgi:bifunctional UDP-N-acetylglucosamine pyrophosphorylase / glucosamine-1-phosphate N-acetyltransferase
MQTTTAIVLAAGQGTRMKSALPKVMHRICGRPILHFVVQAALDAGCADVIVVVGSGRSLVETYLAQSFAERVRTVVQERQLGTGDAARTGLSAARRQDADVLILNGDIPLVRGDDLRPLIAAAAAQRGIALATCELADPTGYGRVVRRDGNVVAIREHRDLQNDEERAIREVNAGVYAASFGLLAKGLSQLVPNNAQGELYLTDAVEHASQAGGRVVTALFGADVLMGVNDRADLARVEQTMQERVIRTWRLAGATIRCGARIETGVILEPDSTVETGAVLRGSTRIEQGAVVDVGCVLTDVVVGAGAVVKPYSVATDARIGQRAQIGPFAHLRPGTELEEDVHVGNFVETKKTKMAAGAKANHLSYLGDGVIGSGANIGAGTIFCNYDGIQKHTTTIESGAFIGSDSQLVAPVTVGAHSYVATGTTVTRDVPAEALAIGRVKQENKEGYAVKLRSRMRAAKQAQGK